MDSKADLQVSNLESFALAELASNDQFQESPFMLDNFVAGSGNSRGTYDVSEADKTVKDIDPAIDARAMMLLLTAEINSKKLAKHHIDSMNAFYKVGIRQIVTNQFTIQGTMVNERTQTDEDRNIGNIFFKVDITDVRLSRPTTRKYISGVEQLLMPRMARDNSLTYCCGVHVDARITATAAMTDGSSTKEQIATIKDFRIAAMPCAVGTELCNTYGQSNEVLSQLKEDPNDVGGYFIIRGMPWAIVCGENIMINEPHVHMSKGHNKEICRLNYMSKIGDAFENSYEVIIRLYENRAITLDVTTRKLTNIEFPFYVLYRAMGMSSDEEIADSIVFGVNAQDDLTKTLLELVERAFRAPSKDYESISRETNAAAIIEFINGKLETAATVVSAKKSKHANRYLNQNILSIFDSYVFPHVGTDSSQRIEKLLFIGYLINKLLLTSIGVLAPTDRDSYDVKSVLAAGPSIAKAFKTQFRYVVAQKLRSAYSSAFRKGSFSTVNLAEVFQGAVHGEELEKGMVQAITSGGKPIHIKGVKTPISVRLSSQMVSDKNHLYRIAVASLIVTPSSSANKQTERADIMRRVQPSYWGLVCLYYSPETGEEVGARKQTACSAGFTDFRMSFTLMENLIGDPELIPLATLSPSDISARKLAQVFMGGKRIGCCKDAHAFAQKYRKMRRLGRIEGDTGIIQKLLVREVHFRLDVGRPKRPLVIVYNNIDEYISSRVPKDANKTPVEFRQWVELTHQDLLDLHSGKATMNDLENRGVLEYITAGEQANCYIAMNIEVLRANASNPLTQYTHCDIDQASMSLLSLATPWGNNSEPNRVCYAANHRKGAISQLTSFTHSIAKDDKFMVYVDTPTITTFTDLFTVSAGQNVMVAMLIYNGYNMEDSVILNQGSIDAGMFAVITGTSVTSKLEKNEQFAAPDATGSIPKRGVSYAHIEKGFARKNSIVHKGDAIIAKSVLDTKSTAGKKTYIDRSVVHTNEKPMLISNVQPKLRDSEDQPFGRVRILDWKPAKQGDKFCLTPDHEVLTTRGWIPIYEVVAGGDLVATRTASGALAWEYPTETSHFEHRGNMYLVNGEVNLAVTMEHKMLIVEPQIRADGTSLVPAAELVDRPHVTYLRGSSGVVPMYSSAIPHGVLRVLSLAILFGKVSGSVFTFNTSMCARVDKVFQDYDMVSPSSYFTLNFSPHFAEKDILLVSFPAWCWRLSRAQARMALRLAAGGPITLGVTSMIVSPELAGQLQCLSILAGHGATYTASKCLFVEDRVKVPRSQTDVRGYLGQVCCLEVPNHVFYVRREGRPSWTGNSSRTGNKGICGLSLPAAMMPYTAEGVVPDIIVNPHSIPTRMAINQLQECVAAQLAMLYGRHVDGTSFTSVDVEKIISGLRAAGKPLGEMSVMYNPETGERMEAVLFGPTTYMRYAKFIEEENYANRTGPTSAVTNQPVRGRARNGGMRIGEMEKDVISGVGSMLALQQKFYSDSDGTTIYICRRCHERAIANEKTNMYACSNCREYADIHSVSSSYTTNALIEDLEAMNIGTKIHLEPHRYPVTESSFN